LEDEIRIFTDVTQEEYDNVVIPDQYRVRYFTFGASAQF
jgi:hypothetical protein